MQKKPNILRLLSAPGRYIKLRISSICKKLVKKTKKKTAKVPNILENEIYDEEKLQKMSIDKLRDC